MQAFSAERATLCQINRSLCIIECIRNSQGVSLDTRCHRYTEKCFLVKFFEDENWTFKALIFTVLLKSDIFPEAAPPNISLVETRNGLILFKRLFHEVPLLEVFHDSYFWLMRLIKSFTVQSLGESWCDDRLIDIKELDDLSLTRSYGLLTDMHAQLHMVVINDE